MLRSMTGFCKTDAVHKDVTCHVEIKSVNHRFLDVRINLPKSYSVLEEPLKKAVRKRIQRGKLDIHLQLEVNTEQPEKMALNPKLWNNIKEIINQLETDLGRPLQLSISDLTGIRDLLLYEQNDLLSAEDMETLFRRTLEKGIDALIEMKEREGCILLERLQEMVMSMRQQLDQLPIYLKEAAEKQKQKLSKNLEYLEVDFNPEDPRILQEIGLLLDRMDITEEIDRSKAHLVQLSDLFESEEQVGRRADFILQELNREANTICSKSGHLSITQIGVALKSEIEKVREQIQNIE